MIVGTSINLIAESDSGEVIIFRLNDKVKIKKRNYASSSGVEEYVGKIAAILPYTNEVKLDTSAYLNTKAVMINFNQIISIEHYIDPTEQGEEDGTGEATFDINTKNTINLIYQELLETKALCQSCWNKLNGGSSGGGTITIPSGDDTQQGGGTDTQQGGDTDTTITKIDIPEVTNTVLVYDGTAQHPTYTVDTEIISVVDDTVATNAGDYSIGFSLIDTVGNTWIDDTTEKKTTPWVIGKATLPDPTIVCNPAINNEAQIVITTETSVTITVTREGDGVISLTGDNYINPSDVSVEGNVITLTNLIGYIGVPLYVTIDEGTNYDEYSTSAIYIAQQEPSTETQVTKVTIPTLTNDSVTYTGEGVSPVYSINDSLVTVTDTSVATTVGNYTIGFVLNDTVNTTWTDDTTEKKTSQWNIIPKRVAQPVYEDNQVVYYTGSDVSVVYTCDTSDVSISGTETATAVSENDYVATFGLKDTVNTAWDDDDTTSAAYQDPGYTFDLTWNIEKRKPSTVNVTATPQLTESNSDDPNYMGTDYDITVSTETSITITLDYEGDCGIGVDRINEYGQDLTISGKTITLNNVGNYIDEVLNIYLTDGELYDANVYVYSEDYMLRIIIRETE
jgi:hypothetical protein